jgi:hypothetical protein
MVSDLLAGDLAGEQIGDERRVRTWLRPGWPATGVLHAIDQDGTPT